jgi:RimJ/RimL family protein N-acetyltransferase
LSAFCGERIGTSCSPLAGGPVEERRMEGKVPLVRGTPDDIPAIMALERGPGFDRLVGRWDSAEHQSEMARPGSLYLLWKPAGTILGFALVQDLDSRHDSAYLKRIAVAEPGKGVGGLLIEAILERLFTGSAINRVSLNVFPENERAVRAYRRLGFETEGLCRENYRNRDGAYRSSLLMAALRRDWLVRNSPARV